MQPDAVPLAAVAIVGGIAAVVAFRILERRRSEAFRGAALRLGFAFAPEPDARFLEAFGALPLFQRGRRRSARNVLSRPDRTAAQIFGYRYTVGTGRSSDTRRQTVAAFTLDGVDLPAFVLAPEHFGHRVASIVGFDDVDFADDPEFSRRWHLTGADRAAIVALFDGDLRSALREGSGWTIQASGNRLIVFRPRKSIAPGDLHELARDTAAVAELFARRCTVL